MVSEECRTAYAEVLQILNSISYIDYIKIPIEKIKLFKKYAKKDIDFAYDPNLTLDEQNVSEKAKIIIALLFRDYWATPAQREKIISKQNYDVQKIEEEKTKKCSNVFSNNKNIMKNEEKEEALLDIRNEKWYKKLFLFLKKVFKGK